MEVLETALIHVRPDTDPRIVALYEETLALQRYAESRVIQSDDDIRLATDDLAIISRLKRTIEEKRKEYIGPINEHLKAVNDCFKLYIEPVNQADAVTREKILTYRKEQERVRQEQERINQLRIEAAQAEMRLKGEITEEVSLVEVLPEGAAYYRTESGALGTVITWKFEVVDFGLLPDRYKLPDTIRIRKMIIAGGVIPGVRAWQEESLRVTPSTANTGRRE